jgi:hypothetical protein
VIFMCLPFEMVWRGTVGRVCKDFARILDCAPVRRCMREDRWERYSHGMPPTLRFAAKVHALAVAPNGVYVALDNIIVLVSATGAVLRTIRYNRAWGNAPAYAMAVRGDQLFAACARPSGVYPGSIYGWKDDIQFTVMAFNSLNGRAGMWATDTALFVVVNADVYELREGSPVCHTHMTYNPLMASSTNTTMQCGGLDIEVVANRDSRLLVATVDGAFAGHARTSVVRSRWVNIDTGRINTNPPTRGCKHNLLFVTIEKTTREIPCTPPHVAVYKGVVFTGGRTLCMW